MKLTREEALRLHRQMWSDMQAVLGDDPSPYERIKYKREWCELHFPNESIYASCFLCEYTNQFVGKGSCREDCPIIWPYGRCETNCYYYIAPISEVLALPERRTNEWHDDISRYCGRIYGAVQDRGYRENIHQRHRTDSNIPYDAVV